MGGHLTQDALFEVADAAARGGILGDAQRAILLAHLDPALRNSLVEHKSPREQALLDLTALDKISDRPELLQGWLWAAYRLARGREEEYVFLEHYARLTRGERSGGPISHPPPPPVAAELAAGELFDGRFELVERLSESLFSLVWRARDTWTDNDVALKLHRHPLDARTRERLRRSAQFLCRTNHPNIVRAFDVCPPGRQTPFYYWMEYMPGGDLMRAIVHRQVGRRAALLAVIDAGEGLVASHEAGVCHRDVQPDNILLGANSRACLADFDLIHDGASGGDTLRPIKLPFTAPEAVADPRAADQRADIFGLARTAQFILFADSHLSLGSHELPRVWSHAALTVLDDRALAWPTELAALLRRATAIHPEARPRTVRDFLHELREAIDDANPRLGGRFLLGEILAERDGSTLFHAEDSRRLDPDGAPAQVVVERFDKRGSDEIDAVFPGGRWSDVELGLSHPNIVGVRSRGRDRDGCYWQALDLPAEAAPLDAVLAQLGAQTLDPFEALTRTGRLLREVAHALAYAHVHGVVHHRLTIGAIRVGDDAPHVGGWTFARRRRAGDGQLEVGADLAGLGAIIERVDVALTALPALGRGMTVETREAARAAIGRSRDDLRAIRRMLAQGTLTRVDALERELARWCRAVEGRQTLVLVEDCYRRAVDRRAEARRLQHEAEALMGNLPLWAPLSEKEPVWALEDRARRLLDEARADEGQWWAAIHEYSAVVPEARERRVDALLGWLDEADEADDHELIARTEAQLAIYRDMPRVEAALDVDKRVTLEWSRADLQVAIARVVERRRRLVAEPLLTCPPGLRFERALPRGDYIVTGTLADGPSGRWPIRVDRRPAGGPLVFRLDDAPLAEQAPDEVYVPAGPCILGGGGDLVVDGMERHVAYVDAFFMKRHAETHDAFAHFLNALVADGRREDAERYQPRGPRTVPDQIAPPLYVRTADGMFVVPETGALQPGYPVAGLTWFAAAAYAEHMRAVTGRDYRLPFEVEWEKAARGVDGRMCPWGRYPDEARGNVTNSRQGLAAPVAVAVYLAHFATDVSPYGVAGLGGNMRTWCADVWRRDGPSESTEITPDRATDVTPQTLMVVRGAAWSASRAHMQSANRYADPAGHHPTTVGIRLVRSI